jgi:hypothetical protein
MAAAMPVANHATLDTTPRSTQWKECNGTAPPIA